MATGKLKPLHMAKSLEDLNGRVSREKLKSATPKVLCKVADKLFLQAKDARLGGDEEHAYVLFMRFIEVFKALRGIKDYKTRKKEFDQLLPMTKVTQAIEAAEKLSESLRERYAVLSEPAGKRVKLENHAGGGDDQVVPSPLSAEQLYQKGKDSLLPLSQLKPQKSSQGGGLGQVDPAWFESRTPSGLLDVAAQKSSGPPSLSPQQVYTCLQQCPNEILVLDCRLRREFLASHVDGKKFPQWLSIPEEAVRKGVTNENVLSFLNTSGKIQWKERAKKKWIVLVDEDSTVSLLSSSDSSNGVPILSLRDAIYKWDTSVQLSQEPFVLEGGYAMWYLSYAPLCVGTWKKKETKTVASSARPADRTAAMDYPSFPTLSEPSSNEVEDGLPNEAVDDGTSPIPEPVPARTSEVQNGMEMGTQHQTNPPVTAQQPASIAHPHPNPQPSPFPQPHQIFGPDTTTPLPITTPGVLPPPMVTHLPPIIPSYHPLPPPSAIPIALSLEGESTLLTPTLSNDSEISVISHPGATSSEVWPQENNIGLQTQEQGPVINQNFVAPHYITSGMPLGHGGPLPVHPSQMGSQDQTAMVGGGAHSFTREIHQMPQDSNPHNAEYPPVSLHNAPSRIPAPALYFGATFPQPDQMAPQHTPMPSYPQAAPIPRPTEANYHQGPGGFGETIPRPTEANYHQGPGGFGEANYHQGPGGFGEANYHQGPGGFGEAIQQQVPPVQQTSGYQPVQPQFLPPTPQMQAPPPPVQQTFPFQPHPPKNMHPQHYGQAPPPPAQLHPPQDMHPQHYGQAPPPPAQLHPPQNLHPQHYGQAPPPPVQPHPQNLHPQHYGAQAQQLPEGETRNFHQGYEQFYNQPPHSMPQNIPQGGGPNIPPQNLPQGVGPNVQNPRVAQGPIPDPPIYEKALHLPSHPPVQPPIPPPISMAQPNQFINQSNQFNQPQQLQMQGASFGAPQIGQQQSVGSSQSSTQATAAELRIQELERQLAAKSQEVDSQKQEKDQVLVDAQKRHEQEIQGVLHLQQELAREKEALERDRERERALQEQEQLRREQERAHQEQELETQRQQLAFEREQHQRDVEEQRRQLLILKEQFEREKQLVLQEKEQLRHFELRKQQENQRMFTLSQGLPPGWQKRLDRATGRFYYVDHSTKTTHWNPPTNWLTYQAEAQRMREMQARTTLPPGGQIQPGLPPQPQVQPQGARGQLPPHTVPQKPPSPSTGQSPSPIASQGLPVGVKGPQPMGQTQPGAAPTSATKVPQPQKPFPPDSIPVVDRSKKPQVTPMVDRSSKPKPAMSHAMHQKKIQNLQPVYGSGGPALMGLRNLGNTCFMNSTLQCLSATSPLVEYFLNGRFRRDVNHTNPLGTGGELAEEFNFLITIMWRGQYRSISPRDFKSTISKFASQFSGTAQQDSQEFLAFLLDGLHEDLNRVRERRYIQEGDSSGVSDPELAKRSWDNHRKRNDSIIVDLFQGQFRSTVVCMECRRRSVTFEAFMYLSVPLPSHANGCSVQDCIRLFAKEERVTGKDKWYCSGCKTHREASKRIEVWKLPPILLIHLKRFSFEGMWRQKKQNYVEFPLNSLDMSPHVVGPKPPRPYALYGVSNHFGTMTGGHYTAYCFNSHKKKFYCFDDHEIRDVSPRHVKSSAAYLLFYSVSDFAPPRMFST